MSSYQGSEGRPRVLLLISSGWAVRNYLRSEFLALMRRDADVIVLMTPGDAELEWELRERGIRVGPLIPCELPQRYTWTYSMFAVAHNRRVGLWNPVLWKWSTRLQSPLKRPYHELHRAAARMVSHSPLYELFYELTQRALKDQHLERLYKALFDDVRPSLVFSTNPYALDQLPVTILAKHRGIPTLASVLSWDNMTYLGPLPLEHDYYSVWSESMRDDLLLHKPHLTPERIQVTGTPQFDFHLNHDLVWSREEFFARVGGDPSRGLLTYGTNVASVFPDEPEFIAQLWESIRRTELPNQPQLLIRIHPHDNTERFEMLRGRCRDLLITRPWPYDAQRFWWFSPGIDDLALLSNTIRYSDVGLSTASSLALDYSILDKPGVNVAFPGSPSNTRSEYVRICWDSYHYRRVITSGAVRQAHSFDELLEHVSFYMQNPKADEQARAKLVRTVCGSVDGRSCSRIAAMVMECIDRCATREMKQSEAV